ncbi:unnamed protein product [Urochloa humidicola]
MKKGKKKKRRSLQKSPKNTASGAENDRRSVQQAAAAASSNRMYTPYIRKNVRKPASRAGAPPFQFHPSPPPVVSSRNNAWLHPVCRWRWRWRLPAPTLAGTRLGKGRWEGADGAPLRR